MFDVISYSKNISLLPAELVENLPDNVTIDEENGGVSFNVCKTRIVKNDQGESMAWMRINDPQNLQCLENLQALAVCEHDPQNPLKVFDVLFADSDATAIYDRVYDQTPRVVVKQGVEYTITKPRHFCELAYCAC